MNLGVGGELKSDMNFKKNMCPKQIHTKCENEMPNLITLNILQNGPSNPQRYLLLVNLIICN